MGHLLGLIVERNRPITGLMISALVTYLDANDARPGFYSLAQQLGDLARGASASAKFDFWVSQVKALHQYYAPALCAGRLAGLLAACGAPEWAFCCVCLEGGVRALAAGLIDGRGLVTRGIKRTGL